MRCLRPGLQFRLSWVLEVWGHASCVTELRTIRLLPDGTLLNDPTIQKIRSGEQGWHYAAALLETFGAESMPSGDREDWLRTWLPKLTRRLKHSGNYKYCWAIDRSARRFLPDSLP